jgi:hypothetical protein
MPSLRHISATVKNDEPLNLATSKIGDGSNASLPTKDAQPTHDVRQEFLVLLWSEFRHPVVLSAGCWRPEAAVSLSLCTFQLAQSPVCAKCVSTYIDAISAIETMTKPIHTAVTRNMTIAPPVPPLVSGIVNVLVGVSCLSVRTTPSGY